MADTNLKIDALLQHIEQNWDESYASFYGDKDKLDLKAIAANLAQKQGIAIDGDITQDTIDLIQDNMAQSIHEVHPPEQQVNDIDQAPELVGDNNPQAKNEFTPLNFLPPLKADISRALTDYSRIERRLQRGMKQFITRKKLNQQHNITLDKSTNIALLLSAFPQFAQNPQLRAALLKKAEELGLPLEELMRLSFDGENLPPEAIKRAKNEQKDEAKAVEADNDNKASDTKIAARDVVLGIVGNAAPIMALGFTAFRGSHMTRNGKINGLTFTDKENVEYTHKFGKTSVKIPLGSVYNAGIALKEAKLHVASNAAYNADGSAKPLTIKVNTKGFNKSFSRDLSILAALQAASAQQLPVLIQTKQERLGTFLDIKNGKGEFVLKNFNAEAVSQMQREGVDVQKLIDAYNAQALIAENQKLKDAPASFESPLTNAADEQQNEQDVPKAKTPKINASNILFASASKFGSAAASAAPIVRDALKQGFKNMGAGKNKRPASTQQRNIGLQPT